MERRELGSYGGACFLCPARVFAEGKYYCDPTRLNDGSALIDVSRFRPYNCPQPPEIAKDQPSPELVLRKLLRK